MEVWKNCILIAIFFRQFSYIHSVLHFYAGKFRKVVDYYKWPQLFFSVPRMYTCMVLLYVHTLTPLNLQRLPHRLSKLSLRHQTVTSGASPIQAWANCWAMIKPFKIFQVDAKSFLLACKKWLIAEAKSYLFIYYHTKIFLISGKLSYFFQYCGQYFV